MITIGQIAEIAGVSKSTVSRVLNSSGYVQKEKKERIEKIIREYHYIPSATAQNLSRQDTNTIGVIIPELDNTFYSEVLSGATEVADANKLNILLCNTCNNADKEREALLMMERQRVKGVIFSSAIGYIDDQKSKSVKFQLKGLHVPVVLVDREIENVQWDGVFYENFQSAYLAAERLIKKGKTRIGFITGDMDLNHSRERYRGFIQALEDYNVPLLENYIYKGDYTVDTAYKITKEMIESGDYPEAMVLSNNFTTLGFMKCLTEKGMVLGRDIDAVGIDHIPVLDMVGFNYECVTRDAKEQGRLAMELLLERFQNPQRERKIYIVPCISKFHDN